MDHIDGKENHICEKSDTFVVGKKIWQQTQIVGVDTHGQKHKIDITQSVFDNIQYWKFLWMTLTPQQIVFVKKSKIFYLEKLKGVHFQIVYLLWPQSEKVLIKVNCQYLEAV